MQRIVVAAVLVASFSLAQAADDNGARKPPEGFISLFNGKDLSDWQHEKVAKAWEVQDGVIYHTGKGGGNLKTAKKYKDFEFYCDWKIMKGGDSGIYLRGQPQVQIWDNKEGSGGLWNNPGNAPGKVPLVVADKAPGEWNTFYIKMVGEKVTVKLNGQTVVDNTVLENYWERDKPIYSTGAIELQNHGNTLYFRNIFVRELPAK